MKNMLIILILSALAGCTESNFSQLLAKKTRPVLVAQYTAKPVVVDGVLNDAVWKKAKVYKMKLAKVQADKDFTLQGPGTVQLAWDKKNLYVAVKFYDDDIVAEGKKDQMHHYKLGDLCELFLKPVNHSWYWELYVTPLSKKSTFFFPGEGRCGLPSNFTDYSSGLKVAAKVKGTINNWKDKDEYWTAEMAMPIKDLTARGEKFGPNAKWRILVARYNYSVYSKRQGPEYSMVPQLPIVNYHLLSGYADLKLVK